MKEKKGIIFDMDGTVWDSSENVARSWTVKVQEAGFDRVVTQDDIKSVMGKPMDVIADTLFTYTKKGKQRNALREACEHYEIEYLREHGGTLYPDVIKTWEKLKKDGYHLYIVSNCQAGYVEAFLEFFKIPWGDPSCLIEDIECYGNNFLQKDENIKLLADRNGLTSACYVGDIQSDYDATMKAGFPFIHAAYGFGTIDAEVPKISKFRELRTVIKEVI
jgi:phosphoglycolate phosphatase